MRWLELRVHPPLVALAVGGLMKLVSLVPLGRIELPYVEAAAFFLAALAGVLAGPALASFFWRHTTPDPHSPQKATSLLTGGVYRLTRNPMYLGLALLLAAWAALLQHVGSWAGPALLVAYLTHFQVAPEERVLVGLFGQEYAAYCQRVRRWL